MFSGYIYRHWIINEEGEEKSYIGQVFSQKHTPEKRWGRDGKGYLGSKDEKVTKFANAIREYGWDNFKHDIILKIECITEEELWFWLDEWECYYIERYDSYYNGYNGTLGGKGARGWEGLKGEKNPMYGKHWDEEHKQHLSEMFKGENHPLYGKVGAMKGKHHTEEAKAKIGKANTGKSFSKEHKHKISESRKDYTGEKHPMYGKHHTDESKLKMSESLKGKQIGIIHNKRKCICLETGDIFETVKEASAWCNGNVTNNLKGRTKSAGRHPITNEKLHWAYCDDDITDVAITD